MPELPEVEVLARHLNGALRARKVRGVRVLRAKSTRPTTARRFSSVLVGAAFVAVDRRAKYLLFKMKPPRRGDYFTMLGHLGMTGRMFLQSARRTVPSHAAVIFDLGSHHFVFEDTRYFGRMTLDDSPLATLGPEPLAEDFDGSVLRARFRRSRQAIKVKLLDQGVVAGIGNIYACEALFRSGISPRKAAGRLTKSECHVLADAIRITLAEAIAGGSTIPLDFAGTLQRDRLFYYGRAENASDNYEERLAVYDREGDPCLKCASSIRRIVQNARGTWYCPTCQRG